MKSLLVSGYTLLIWGMIPLFLTSTFTSCGKLAELLGDEDEDEDYNYPNNNEVITNDGAAPYFELETTSITLPAVRSEEGVEMKCKTNISYMYYKLEKYEKHQNGELVDGEEYPVYILESPSSDLYNTTDENTLVQSLLYNTNYTNEKQTDNLLIYAYDNDSLLATIPIEQEVGPSVNVTQTASTYNSITLTLEGQNDATCYTAIITTDSISMSQLIRDINYGYQLSEETYSLQEQPTITFSNLAESTKYYIYLQGGTDSKSMCGITQYIATTSIRSQQDALIMEFQLNALNDNTVYLPFNGKVRGVIDWGDGTTETLEGKYSSTDLFHHYKDVTSSTVSVTFKGTVEALITNSGTSQGEVLQASLLGITQWGNPELQNINFSGAIALKQVVPDTKGALADVTDFNYCFYGCTSLTSLPEDLFTKATNATGFDQTFYGCTSLTSLPKGLFAKATGVTRFYQTFYGCTNLTTLPSDLFANNTEVTSFNETFSGCTSLTELPEGLFDRNTKVENINQIFYKCNKLKQIPVTLFDHMRMLRNTSNAFSQCTALTGESPYTVVNGQKVHLYERQKNPTSFLDIKTFYGTYAGCTNLSDYTSIPDTWK